MKSGSDPIKKEKSLDLTATHDERPAHHRLHSHLEKNRSHHDRVPTTYPKPEEDKPRSKNVVLNLFQPAEEPAPTTVDSDNLYNMSCGDVFRALFCCGKK